MQNLYLEKYVFLFVIVIPKGLKPGLEPVDRGGIRAEQNSSGVVLELE